MIATILIILAAIFIFGSIFRVEMMAEKYRTQNGDNRP